MTWEELQEKHKQFLEEWHELRKEIDPLDKICMAKEVKPNGDIEPMPIECLNQWCDLMDKEAEIFAKIAKLHRDYFSKK